MLSHALEITHLSNLDMPATSHRRKSIFQRSQKTMISLWWLKRNPIKDTASLVSFYEKIRLLGS
jgi:hypothetical protein